MISVLIPTADRLGPLHRALRSLSRQEFRDFEVIVVNDGGRSPKPVIDSWLGELRVALIELDQRCGVSRARNMALEAAEGDYVAFLDDDDIYLPTHLGLAHRWLSENRADVTYGTALVSRSWIEAMPRSARTMPRKDLAFDERFLMVANYIHTGSVVTRNFAHSGVRFDEHLSHCEDWDMWLALRRTLGYRFLFHGACTSVYHQVAHRRGTVLTAYESSPTPFTLARRYVYQKWPSSDQHVDAYRKWLQQFDRQLDCHIEHRESVPPHVFDRALRISYPGFSNSTPPDPAWLDSVFNLNRSHDRGGRLPQMALRTV